MGRAGESHAVPPGSHAVPPHRCRGRMQVNTGVCACACGCVRVLLLSSRNRENERVRIDHGTRHSRKGGGEELFSHSEEINGSAHQQHLAHARDLVVNPVLLAL